MCIYLYLHFYIEIDSTSPKRKPALPPPSLARAPGTAERPPATPSRPPAGCPTPSRPVRSARPPPAVPIRRGPSCRPASWEKKTWNQREMIVRCLKNYFEEVVT